MSLVITQPVQSILVVEDNIILRMLASGWFEDAGFTVVEAETGEEGALILASDASIVGVFTDIEMPGPIDGISLANMARSRHPGAAIVIVSGRICPTKTEMPLNALFFGKPYDMDIILTTMSGMLAREATVLH